jgi:hypothetical protein
MQSIEGFDFLPLTFDGDGKLQQADAVRQLDEHVTAASVTDAIVIAHGFRNDERDATRLYTGFLNTFRAHLARPELRPALVDRQFMVAGVYWPSKAFRETFDEDAGTRSLGADDDMAKVKARLAGLKDSVPYSSHADAAIDRATALLPTLQANPVAQDEFVALLLSLVGTGEADATEGMEQIKAQPGSDLLARLDTSRDLVGSIAGRINQFLNLTTWYLMKDRAGIVGAGGVADVIRRLKGKHPTLRIHLVGHSLGARLMAACSNALAKTPIVQPDSLTLLEGAFSHFGFSADNGRGAAGFFRTVVANRIVKGPLIATFSAEDTVVGNAYAIVSRLAGDATRKIGDADDPYGGIGRNGALKTAEAVAMKLAAPGTPYDFKTGVVTSLDGSDGLIKDHGDVTNAHVTYAFASAVART